MTSISEEAFKAAYDTWVETLTDLRIREGGGFNVASQSRRALRAAMEAAAPYLMAEAWEECANGYCEQLANLTLEWEELPNPYRSQS